MLSIVIPESEGFIEEGSRIIKIKETKLQLEHSLLSIKKWEARWHKAFLKESEKTDEELLDYIKCMTLTTNVDPNVYFFIPSSATLQIVDYIENPMSATKIPKSSKDNALIKKGDVLTAEVLYYWMIKLNIPVEFQKWHINQLITLINVIAIKDGKQNPRKLSPEEAKVEQARRDNINAQRRAKYKTKG